LREGEEVEFVIEPSEDNRFKAIKVTGPGGAPPQVHTIILKRKEKTTPFGVILMRSQVSYRAAQHYDFAIREQ